MKNIISKLFLLGFIGFFLACSDEEKPVDRAFEGTTRGAVLRTLESSTDLAIAENAPPFRVLLEVQDGQDGNQTDRVEVYVRYVDRTPEFGLTSNIPEQLFKTIPASDFLTGNRLPRVDLNIFLEELEDFFGVTDEDYTGGDRFVVRLEMHLTDGRVFTNTNTNSTVQGSAFYRARFSYNANLVCPSELNVPFTWVASDFFFQGTPLGDLGFPSGSDALVSDTGTTYTYQSGLFDFGYYCLVYYGADPGCGQGASGSLRLTDICGALSYTGADQFGDPWVISNVSVNGDELTFTWESAYGERSTVTLTRTDGMNWPSNLR